MRISISIGSAYYNGEEWDSLVDYTMAADRIGVDEAWSAEAWGMDAIVPLAYLAAKTEKHSPRYRHHANKLQSAIDDGDDCPKLRYSLQGPLQHGIGREWPPGRRRFARCFLC